MRRKKILLKLIIATGTLLALCVGAYFLMNARSIQLAGKIVTHAETGDLKIALTFDDGPSECTDEILEMLDELDVKCTFFLTGSGIENNMHAAKAIAAAGHEIGNHSYSHEYMILKSMRWIENEIDQTNALIREAGYEGEIYFRPPYCKKLLVLPLELAKRGITTVTWSIEVQETDSVQSIVESVTRQAKPGAIILLHIMSDARRTERDAVPGIVNNLRGQGYEFITVEALLTS